uniref:Spd40 protein n=1 Tax=Streptomyces venezuelae TaxID=54571 RepID=Q3LAJ0_STRVZ|nr:hypothetical protein [Streptomyces venezuelae]CAJ32331.1 Spd40 protein [Streptomyces venezuelae]
MSHETTTDTTEDHDQDDAVWDGRGVVNDLDGPTTGTDNDW